MLSLILKGAGPWRTWIIIAIVASTSGCASSYLDHSRREFYNGNPQYALTLLNEKKVPKRDRILFLMERGTLHQAAGQYTESVRDYNEANDLLEQSETLSVSRGVTSMVVNDNALLFRGYPFERTYLHVMAALSYLGHDNWQDAAVEARRIINTLKPEAVGEYPQDAFSHYLAGFCLELVGDRSNARVRYRKASEFSPYVSVDEQGRLTPVSENQPDLASDALLTKYIHHSKNDAAELVLFILLGKVADYSAASPISSMVPLPYTEIFTEGRFLGRTHTLTDTRQLAITSEKRLAVMKAAKTAGRIAAKRALSYQIEKENALVGSLVWLALLAFEQPDLRHWETLPRYLQVARIACPPDLEKITLKIHTSYGVATRTVHVNAPIVQKSPQFISFIRQFPSHIEAP